VLEVTGRGELERVEGTATGEPCEPLDLWRRERPTGALEDEPGQMPLSEAGDLNLVQRVPVAYRESRQLEVEPDAHGRDEPHTGALEATECVRERAQAGRIDPLQVVDCENDRTRARQQPKRAEDSKGNGDGIDG
jgi:hypothetical protein